MVWATYHIQVWINVFKKSIHVYLQTTHTILTVIHYITFTVSVIETNTVTGRR